MADNPGMGLLIVLAVLLGIGALLVLLTRLDPTTSRRPAPTHRAGDAPTRT